MQAVNETALGGRSSLATNGRRESSESTLKADFATMLADLADPNIGVGSGSLGKIFSAMKELSDENASLCADISCKKQDLRKRSHQSISTTSHEKDKEPDVLEREKTNAKASRRDVVDKEHADTHDGALDQSSEHKIAEQVALQELSFDDQDLLGMPPQSESSVVALPEDTNTQSAPKSSDEALESYMTALMSSEETAENVTSLSHEMIAEELPSESMIRQTLNTQGRLQAGGVTDDATVAQKNVMQQMIVESNPQDNPDLLVNASDDSIATMSVSKSESVDDSGLAVMMAQAGVISVKLKENTGTLGSGLSEEIIADLELIDDSLQAAAAISTDQDLAEGSSDGEAWYSQSSEQKGSSSSSTSLQSNVENQSVTQALATLRANSRQDLEAVPGQKTAQVSSLRSAAGLATSAEFTGPLDNQSGNSLTGTGEAVLPGTGEISGRTEMSRANTQNVLREQMMSLSRDVRKNAEEISKAVMSMAARNLKHLSFELNPHGLGRMEISIDTDGNDEAVKVNLAAESSVTRQLLSQGLTELKDSLSRAGLTADAELAEYSGTDGHEQQSSQGGHEDQRQDHTFFASASANEEVSVEQEDPKEQVDEDNLSLYA